MFRKSNMFDLSQYIKPIDNVIIDKPKKEVVEVVEEIKEKNELKPDDRLEKDQEEIDEKEEEAEVLEQVEPMNNHFENLKTKLLTVKNKPLFIKRNKEKIKSLNDDEQREFLKIAKGVFDNL